MENSDTQLIKKKLPNSMIVQYHHSSMRECRIMNRGSNILLINSYYYMFYENNVLKNGHTFEYKFLYTNYN